MTTMAEIITSAQNPTIKFIRSLEQKKHRQESGLFVVEGVRALTRARLAGIAPDYVISAGGRQDWDQARDIRVSGSIMSRISQQNNPAGVLAIFKQASVPSEFRPSASDVALVLEDIRDPGNLGTIIRTADAAGVRHIALVGDTCDQFSPEAVRATMGSLFGISLARFASGAFMSVLDEWSGEIVATAAGATTDFRRAYQRPTMILMGSEGTGLSAPLAAKANIAVRIPMAGDAESLNVAIASALMIYEVRRSELA